MEKFNLFKNKKSNSSSLEIKNNADHVDTLTSFKVVENKQSLNKSEDPGEKFVILFLIVIALGLLLRSLLHYLIYIKQAIPFPYELDYGEGIVWQQAAQMPWNMYGPIDNFPAIVFHYPPFYGLLVHWITDQIDILFSVNSSMLFVGRTVSVVSTLLIALNIGYISACLITNKTSNQSDSFSSYKIVLIKKYIAAVSASLIVMNLWPVAAWSVVMRVDQLAIMLSLTGFMFAIKSLKKPWLSWISILFFILAVYTKQTSLAAPITVCLSVLLAQKKNWIKPIIAGLICSIILFVILCIQTNNGFARHIILYNVNRFNWDAFVNSASIAPFHVGYFILAITGIFITVKRIKKYERSNKNFGGNIKEKSIFLKDYLQTKENFISFMLITYFCLSMLTLVTLAKSGSNFNYLIEPMCVSVIFIGKLISDLIDNQFNKQKSYTNVYAFNFIQTAILFVILDAQIFLVPTNWRAALNDTVYQENQKEISLLVKNTPGPILSDNMVLIKQANKQVLWEPAIFAELANAGIWDDQKLILLIDQHFFKIIITRGSTGDRKSGYDTRWSVNIDQAIKENYKLLKNVDNTFLYVPK